MKQALILSLSILLATAAFAQEKGIHFEHGLSWAQIAAKAKAESKLIMIDCYTTWCVPCKMMAKTIFTDDAVGAFYNEHFINVKMQMDTSKDDAPEIKASYADANHIKSKYGVVAYPTFLFLDAEGKLVDKSMGYNPETAHFLEKGKVALDPDNRLGSLLKAYQQNPNDEVTIKKLAARIFDLDKETKDAVFDKFMATDGGKLTREKIGIIEGNTGSTSDKGFKILQQHENEIDELAGKGTATRIFNRVIYNTEVWPIWKKNEGKLDKVDWLSLKKSLEAKYPKYADTVIRTGKLEAIGRTEQIEKKSTMIEQFIHEYEGKTDVIAWANNLNSFAYETAKSTNDMKLLNKALQWSKKSIATPGLPEQERRMYKDTYASILYKTGKKAEAIKMEKEVREQAEKAGDVKDLVEAYKQTLERMQKGGKDLF